MVAFLEANGQELDILDVLGKPNTGEAVASESFRHLDGRVNHLAYEENVKWQTIKTRSIKTSMGVFKNPFENRFDFGSAKSRPWREEVRKKGQFKSYVTMVWHNR